MSLKNIEWQEEGDGTRTPGRYVITDGGGSRFEPLSKVERRQVEKLARQEEEKQHKPKLRLKKQKLRLKSKPAFKHSKKITHANGQIAHALKGKAEFKIGDPVPEKRYTAVSRDVFMCPEVKALSHWAKSLLVDLMIDYDGSNNGKLKCSFAHMHKKWGWRSSTTLLEARRNLERARLLVRIDEGYKGRAARYGLINCLVTLKGVEK